MAVAHVDEQDAGFPGAGGDGRIDEGAKDGGRGGIGHGAAADGILEHGQAGEFHGRGLVDEAFGQAFGLAQEAFPEGKATDAAAFAGMQAMVLSSGQDEFGFRQSGGGQEGAPKPGLVIGQVHGHVPFRPVGRDDGAGGGGQAIGVIGQGPDGVGMDGQGQAGLEVGLEGFEEAAAHVAAGQVDGAAGGGQGAQAGTHLAGRGGQDEFRTVFGFETGQCIKNVLGAGTDIQTKRALDHGLLLVQGSPVPTPCLDLPQPAVTKMARLFLASAKFAHGDVAVGGMARGSGEGQAGGFRPALRARQQARRSRRIAITGKVAPNETANSGK